MGILKICSELFCSLQCYPSAHSHFLLTTGRPLVGSLSLNSARLVIFIRNLTFFLAFPIIFAHSVQAEVSFEVYGGYQTSPHSVIEGKYLASGINEELIPFRFNAGWKGKSFSMPPYYGFRITNWQQKSGWGLEFTHSKAYADYDTMKETDFELLQFTDGLNNLLLHRQSRVALKNKNLLTYYGYGIGIILPHVEFQARESLPRTFGYQYGGPSIGFNTGLKLPMNEKRYVFSEYKFTASWINVTLNEGGRLKSRVFTNALNVGLGFDF